MATTKYSDIISSCKSIMLGNTLYLKPSERLSFLVCSRCETRLPSASMRSTFFPSTRKVINNCWRLSLAPNINRAHLHRSRPPSFAYFTKGARHSWVLLAWASSYKYQSRTCSVRKSNQGFAAATRIVWKIRQVLICLRCIIVVMWRCSWLREKHEEPGAISLLFSPCSEDR